MQDTDVCRTRCRTEYGNPCIRFCPANVYEMVDDEEEFDPKRRGALLVQYRIIFPNATALASDSSRHRVADALGGDAPFFASHKAPTKCAAGSWCFLNATLQGTCFDLGLASTGFVNQTTQHGACVSRTNDC